MLNRLPPRLPSTVQREAPPEARREVSGEVPRHGPHGREPHRRIIEKVVHQSGALSSREFQTARELREHVGEARHELGECAIVPRAHPIEKAGVVDTRPIGDGFGIGFWKSG
ncbi:MAG: hypothetical protein HOQ30_17180 [Gemmatimonadaceae bacterium]|nr:hypothetical protein [Gemmatimonadaceae bacterium]